MTLCQPSARQETDSIDRDDDLPVRSDSPTRSFIEGKLKLMPRPPTFLVGAVLHVRTVSQVRSYQPRTHLRIALPWN